jgi:hypothetical protein
MTRFLYIYTGGNPPASPEEGRKVMEAWMAYFAKMGPRMVEGGAPLGARQSVGGAAASGASGFSIMEAADLAEAVSLTDGHPHLAAGGAIEVLESLPIPG